MSRKDISDYVIHFTKGDTPEDAFRRLQKIISDGFLLGSDGMIKGGYDCVCFSEAPIESLPNGLINPDYYSHYSPFGIMFSKQFIFERGGRPAIYQPDNEFISLSESHRWRHVRYEPPEIDFSWEREWRVKCESLQFDEESATIVVKNVAWIDRLKMEHESEQDFRVIEYSLIFDTELAEMYRTPFQWKVAPLRK